MTKLERHTQAMAEGRWWDSPYMDSDPAARALREEAARQANRQDKLLDRGLWALAA